jgi:hypothetical protein
MNYRQDDKERLFLPLDQRQCQLVEIVCVVQAYDQQQN